MTGAHFQCEMQALGLAREDVARELGVHYRTVGRWMNVAFVPRKVERYIQRKAREQSHAIGAWVDLWTHKNTPDQFAMLVKPGTPETIVAAAAARRLKLHGVDVTIHFSKTKASGQ